MRALVPPPVGNELAAPPDVPWWRIASRPAPALAVTVVAAATAVGSTVAMVVAVAGGTWTVAVVMLLILVVASLNTVSGALTVHWFATRPEPTVSSPPDPAVTGTAAGQAALGRLRDEDRGRSETRSAWTQPLPLLLGATTRAPAASGIVSSTGAAEVHRDESGSDGAGTAEVPSSAPGPAPSGTASEGLERESTGTDRSGVTDGGGGTVPASPDSGGPGVHGGTPSGRPEGSTGRPRMGRRIAPGTNRGRRRVAGRRRD